MLNPKIGVVLPPNHPFVHRGFHYKPSILGAHPCFWKHPYTDIHDLILSCMYLRNMSRFMTQPDGLVYFERVCIVSLRISGEVSHGHSFQLAQNECHSRGCWAHISSCHVFSKLSVERNTGWWLVSTHLKKY